MSSSGSQGGRPPGLSRLDVALALLLAVVAVVAGSALAPFLKPLWDRDGPAMASAAASRRLLRAEQAINEVRSLREALTSKLADEQVAQSVDVVDVGRASGTDAKKLNDRIQNREAVLRALRARLDTAVAGQSTADRELRIATDEAKGSETDAADRLRRFDDLTRAVVSLGLWIVIAAVLVVASYLVRRRRPGKPRSIHARMVLGGSAAFLGTVLLAVTVGWILATAAVALLLLAWVVSEGRSDAGRR